MIFTKEQIEEIARRLSIVGVRDTDMDRVNLLESPLGGDETIAIVKDGENMRISLEDLCEAIAEYISNSETREDFFNVSAYLGRLDPEFEGKAKPCTMEEAVEACPPFIRRAGEFISFLDSEDNTWKTYQMVSDNNEDWLDLSKWENYYETIQSKVYEVISKIANISLEASTDIFIVGEGQFDLTASTDVEATSIAIKRGEEVIATGEGSSLEYTVTVTESTASDIIYTAEFTFAGNNVRTVDTTIHFVDSMYVGGGDEYTEVAIPAYEVSARITPAGSYNVTIDTAGKYMFFIVPNTMTINSATLGGIDLPLDEASAVTIDGKSYKSYRSSNTYDAGNYKIVIS